MTQTVHLVKLCVGASSVNDLADWQARHHPHWPPGRAVHVTRMWPKRSQELLHGGSLYWVVKGVIRCRQRLVDIQEMRGEDGIRRCALVLDTQIILTQEAPRRAFQGWRYLEEAKAPPDLHTAQGQEKSEKAEAEPPLPEALAQSLARLGIL